MVGKYDSAGSADTQNYVVFTGYDGEHFQIGVVKAENFTSVKRDVYSSDIEALAEGERKDLERKINLLAACLNIAYRKPRIVH